MGRFRYTGTNWEGRPWVASAPVRALGDEVTALDPARYPHDGTVASKGHDAQNPRSDHRPRPFTGLGVVRAIDFGGADAHRLAICEQLRAGRDPRIKYVINEVAMFASYTLAGKPAWEWRPYTGWSHDKHTHVSFTDASDQDRSPFDLTGADPMPSLPLQYKDGFSTGRPAWREEVKRVQYALAHLGYDIGAAGADGYYGDDMAAAIVAFRKDHSPAYGGDGHTWTGFSDQLLMRRLGGGADHSHPEYLTGVKGIK